MSTGAVVAGRRTFELAGGWGGDRHDGVPIFVLSRHQPDATMRWPAVTYVSDAMRMAKDAAGGKDVLVHGALTAQLALTAGVLDELQIHLIPVLFGQDRRLFEDRRPATSSSNCSVPWTGRVCCTCATVCGRRADRWRSSGCT